MSPHLLTVAAAARPIFDRLQASLLPAHANEFVSIEPESGDYFLGATLSEAIAQAKAKHPTQLVHTFRLGHAATVHFGTQS